jgi:hypothetical protein
MSSKYRKLSVAIAAAACSAGILAVPAHGVVTLGQVGIPGLNCAGPSEGLQPTVTSGNSYVAPASGNITSWSTRANDQVGPAKLKVYRPSGAANTFTVVGQDTPRALNLNTLNTFNLSPGITVQRGDVIGLGVPTGVAGCAFDVPGETPRQTSTTDASNGATITTTTPSPVGRRVNVSAVLDPTNAFTLGGTQKNKKKGNATVTVNLPNPGSLAVSGNGVKAVTTTVAAAGEVPVKIVAKGKKKSALNDNGKVKLSPTFAFTPTGGTAAEQASKLKLKKN